jgi:hypothetical protein
VPPVVSVEDEIVQVCNGGPPAVTREESLRLIALLDAVRRSLRTGGVVAVQAPG